MKWTLEAKDKIKDYPYYARASIRKKSQVMARKKALECVDLRLVEEAISQVDIDEMLKIEENWNQIDFNENIDVAFCGGVRGCSLSLMDDIKVGIDLFRVLEEEDIGLIIEEAKASRKTFHKTFKGGVSGCPNSCSQPQIKDISIVGFMRPNLDLSKCVRCRKCMGKCPEGAITLNENISIDYENCLDCGKCIKICPTGGIRTMEKGYKLYIGGKLGRRPALASLYGEYSSMEEMEKDLSYILSIYKEALIESKVFRNLLEEKEII